MWGYWSMLNFGTTVCMCMLLLLSRFSRLWLVRPHRGRPPGFAIPGFLQARTLEWVAISFSNAWKWKVKVKSLSRVQLLATPWTAAYEAPPSMGFSRQEYWSGLPLQLIKTKTSPMMSCQYDTHCQEQPLHDSGNLILSLVSWESC